MLKCIFRYLFCLTVVCCGNRAASADPEDPLTTVADVQKALHDTINEDRTFAVTAKVIFTSRKWGGTVYASDSTGTGIFETPDPHLQLDFPVGAILRMKGRLHHRPLGIEATEPLAPKYHEFEILSTNTVPPRPITARQFYSSERLDEPFVLRGIVRDAFQDEIDPNFTFITLDCDGTAVHSAYYTADDPECSVERLMGEPVSVIGIRTFNFPLQLSVRTHFSQIKPASSVIPDPFAAADLPDQITLPISKELIRGRRKTSGFVLARWGNGSCLLQTDTGQRLLADLADTALPEYGSHIVVTGLPDTNLRVTRLRHALWRSAPTNLDFSAEAVFPTTIRNIISDEQGRRKFNARLIGRSVSLCGRLILPTATDKPSVFHLEQDGEIARVDFSSTPGILDGIQNGSIVDATGACIMETGERPSRPLITGFFLATRTMDDIRLVSRPPWWTFERLAVLFGIFLLVLVGVLIWSLMLRRLSELRGAELAKEKLAVAESELKVYERTRLAIELHDMLSQMLSGISMQIGTVRKFFDTNREKAQHHLDIAAKTLFACRENLRDCLWDLRSRALEEPDLGTAIRETLEPHVESTSLVIRFRIPRERLTDNTAHAILSIIRELVVNAIRHGKATTVRIAGCIENGRVLFSVADNGSGFDPDRAPGMAQGHFGLQGIRERIEGFEGDLTVSSAVGQGTKVTIALKLPQDESRSSDHG